MKRIYRRSGATEKRKKGQKDSRRTPPVAATRLEDPRETQTDRAFPTHIAADLPTDFL